MTKGTLYCLGLGPGDPELITFKAWRYLCQCPVLAVPQDQAGRKTADGILRAAASLQPGLDLDAKDTVALDFPMTREAAVLAAAHEEAAKTLAAILDSGRDVALITLGCPTIYASCMYVEEKIAALGYATEIVAGVTSFCAVAARLGQSLCEKDDALLIFPASRPDLPELLDVEANKVIMKVPRHTEALKETLAEKGLLEGASVVSRCGMAGEWAGKLTDMKDSAYFSVILTGKSK
ncbi:precorrin-2 C(20)-methyltransferase [Megasphaera hominis]|jgi:precorrin-2/cobalt-factor-2 C20-methyltransferase|uniref:Precorrin-2 C(20)-methyltransferase n=1 Tax=Megasphaera hominis TaxID=159836 RepID=A0ABR6VHZ5_9FIRM|nr:precorrin-2 C(20)-methyltransferase [Megasphaera hominis]MBC3536911.1 precorrin-2 C(20)-methyltransferase [Megasphaera hominis]